MTPKEAALRQVIALLRDTLPALEAIAESEAKPNGGNTGDEVATLAARGLDNPASLTPAELRRVCASALGQSVGE